MQTRIIQAAAALAFLASPVVSSVASAQEIAPPRSPGEYRYYPAPSPYWGDPGYTQRPGVVFEGRSSAAPRYCIKMCENDRSPCDPIEYKRADMRFEADGDF